MAKNDQAASAQAPKRKLETASKLERAEASRPSLQDRSKKRASVDRGLLVEIEDDDFVALPKNA